MNKLHIDIETYSSYELKDVGLYKYVEAPDFEILMVAYAMNNDPVQIVDLAQGERLPASFGYALFDKEIEKHAHNATFERIALSKYLSKELAIDQWHCSMVKTAYCGLPLALDAVSKAMDLGDKAKSSEGTKLINYFSKPCKPTKKNEGRTRNLPIHDPEKWGAFKKYCKQDVEAEREVISRLARYKMPESERENYIVDQEINDRGIEIDIPMVESVIKMYTWHSAKLMERAQELTSLANPNSPAQLKKWLSDAIGKSITSLAKDDIPAIMEMTEDGAVLEMLRLRQKMSRSSIKKYTRMLQCVCADGRAHGLFQFYGANRTGRWAGRLIQLQNLVQNHLGSLDIIRELAAEGDTESLELLYDDLSSVLAQLVRTAFVAKEGHTFAVADFSSIEARVISWLAKEKWRMDVFNGHGKIYEASAAMMFKVPIESVTKGSDMRAKGKIAELALGYQGAVGAMKQMAGVDTDLTEKEMRSIVKQWRAANPAIVKLWATVEGAAKRVMKTRRPYQIDKLKFDYNGEVLTIELPSGRKLFYQNPTFVTNKFGNEGIEYSGMDQETKQWGRVDTYGGKLTENIVQAIARDLLADAMLRLSNDDFDIVMHVHDEAVCEVDTKITSPQNELDVMCLTMSEPVPWADGLPLAADGYITPFYKKD